MTEDIDRFALQNLTEEEKNDLQKSLQIVLKTFMNGMVTLMLYIQVSAGLFLIVLSNLPALSDHLSGA